MNILFADNSTINDLQLYRLNNKGETGLLQFYNSTVSTGGFNKISELFYQPTNDLKDIVERQNIIRYLGSHYLLDVFNSEDIEILDAYIKSTHSPVWSYFAIIRYIKALLFKAINPAQYQYIIIGVVKVLRFLQALDDLLDRKQEQTPEYLSSIFNNLSKLFKTSFINRLKKSNLSKLSFNKILKIDYLLHEVNKQVINELLNQFYLLDAFTSIGKVSHENGFSYPLFKQESEPKLIIRGIFHPLVNNPVLNDIELNNRTICLTGPNMSGKTTLLKSIGICAYLAHIGLPVPCSYMELTSIRSIITNIENFDNVSLGYSYFYNEVRRVKSAISRIKSYDDILWIADELFRGTNIKDAQDATKVIIEKIAKVTGLKIISTHLIEVTQELKELDNISFKRMKTEIINDLPEFSYTIEDGISDIRLGMYYLRKEGVIDDLDDLISDRP